MSSTTCTCPLETRRWSNDAGICETCGLPTEPALEIDPTPHPAAAPAVDPKPDDRCLCGAMFRTAEDYRDHLPCPAVAASYARPFVAAHPFAFSDAAIDSYVARILSSESSAVPRSRRGVMRAILAEVLRGECPPVAVMAVVDPDALERAHYGDGSGDAAPAVDRVEMVMGPQVQTCEGVPGGRIVAPDGAVRVVHDDAALGRAVGEELARVIADIGTGVDLVDDAVEVDIDDLPGAQSVGDEDLLELLARNWQSVPPLEDDDDVAADLGLGDGIFAPDASELNAEVRKLGNRVDELEKSFSDLMDSWKGIEEGESMPTAWKDWVGGEIQRHANRMHERIAALEAKITAAKPATAAAPTELVAEALRTLVVGLAERALTPGARTELSDLVRQIRKGA